MNGPQGTPEIRTLLLLDLVDSTRLVGALGDRAAAEVFARHDRIARDLLREHAGREIDRTDGFLLLFDRPISAVRFALAYHGAVAALSRETGHALSARVGVHLGEVILRDNTAEDIARGAKPIEVEGIAKPLAARVMGLAQGGQTLLTRGVFDLARRAAVGADALAEGAEWLAHGAYVLKGIEEPTEIFECGLRGAAPLAPPADSEKARRAVTPGDEAVLGWRPAAGLAVPRRENFVLKEQLGTGGFGEVWLAEHHKTREPRVYKFCFEADRLRGLKREVALFRLLKETLGDRGDIARVLDWSFDEAPFWLESEYTPGGDLVQWAEARGGIANVPLAVRLELVAQVAEALGAAHSVGVLHKDVKPANILVTGAEAPKARLTDFGIGIITDRERLVLAGVTAAGLTETTLTGNDSSRTGTQLYMAPELAEGKPATLQSDIFALGVMLYQLAAGDLRKALATDWRDEVADELLREDIAACVLGDPRRRLGNAEGLAERLRTLEERRATLNRERREKAAAEAALVALDKSRKRRKVLAVVATAGAAVLAVMTLLYFRTEEQRVRAEAAEQDAKQRAEEAERALAIAREQGEGAFNLVNFVLRDLKTAMDEELSADSGIHVPVANEISHAIAGRVASPVVDYFKKLDSSAWPEEMQLEHAERMLETGSQFRAMGRYEEGMRLVSPTLELRERVLGAEHEDTAESLDNLAGLLMDTGDHAAARPLFERALAIRERVLGPEHPGTGSSLNNLAGLLLGMGDHATARPLYERALAICEKALGPEHPHTATSLTNLARVLEETGDHAATRPLLERALAIQEKALGPEHPDTANSLNNLAALLGGMGDHAAAQPLLERALAIHEKTLGPEHPRTATILNNLAMLLQETGDYAAARPLHGRALAIYEKTLGPDHPGTATGLVNLAALLRGMGDYAAARPLHERALAIQEKALGPEHPHTTMSMGNLAVLLGSDMGDYAAARPLLERVLAIREKVLGPEHPDTGISLNNLGILLGEMGELDAAEEHLARAAGVFRLAIGEDHPYTRRTIERLEDVRQRIAEREGVSTRE